MSKFLEVSPVLPVRDVRAAIDYYTLRLGFTLRFQDHPSDPKYAGVERNQVRLHLQWHAAEDFQSVDKLCLRFLIDDPDALFNEYKAMGVFHDRTVLKDMPWKTREFAFYDPDGNGLFFYRNL